MYSKATENLEISLQIRKNYYGNENHASIADSYQSIG